MMQKTAGRKAKEPARIKWSDAEKESLINFADIDTDWFWIAGALNSIYGNGRNHSACRQVHGRLKREALRNGDKI